MTNNYQFWIDRGGTFTDIVARHPDGQLTTRKLLSVNPGRYEGAAIAGIRAILGLASGEPIPPVIETVKMGTTVATNALLERRGEPTLLLVNHGFGDALRIGNQTRPKLFELAIHRPPQLYERVVEVSGRVDAQGQELEPLDEDAARASLCEAAAAGLRACAIALIHGWQYPAHEQRLAALAAEAGYTQISASHDVSPLVRLIPRAETTVADAYLSPVLRRHVGRLAQELGETKLTFMQSHGCLTDAATFRGKDAVLSGPAGGIVGAVRTAAAAGYHQVIGFDMGGTSTDVALYAGAFDRRSEAEIAGVHLRTPMLSINTVAAGGGSILHYDSNRFRVGPDSANADPGPACYRRGGPLTVTDANVCLGKIQPRHFPPIFGPAGDEMLDAQVVHEGFASWAAELGRDPRDVAEGFIRIAVANMAHAIKQVSVQRGHEPSCFVLQCFGGAGGQHACLVADELGIDTIFIHPFAGVLSAYGMGLADQSIMRERAIERLLDESTLPDILAQAEDLVAVAKDALAAQSVGAMQIIRSAQLRYQGNEAALTVPLGDCRSMRADFAAAHRRHFGFAAEAHAIMVEAISVEAIQPGEPAVETSLRARTIEPLHKAGAVEIWSGGRAHKAPVYDRASLLAGDRLAGPALIHEANATTVIEPGWNAAITTQNHMILTRTSPLPREEIQAGKADPVLLELFGNVFMSIAEQAGAVLQNTAQSVNIKERLDFSCALFDARGNLIANAPHVPVHLGAMGESVKTVLARRGGTLKPGDVIALNNPFAGGSHLPDLTIITPLFDPAGTTLRAFAASRGHHADIGGLTPGSTPPDSRTLDEEGVVLDDFLLLSQGNFREAEFRDALSSAAYPARNPDANVADALAQVAANAAAARALEAVAERYGWDVVNSYMSHLLDHAENCVRRVVERLSNGDFATTMDDGAPLRVAVRIDSQKRAVTVDFTGSGPQHVGNFNAPAAVIRAVVLYVFRCLVAEDIPLNDGCMRPITLVIPAGSFLSPSPGAAVVAGNTEVSQAACNALLAALGACASSQATMNNFLFGNATHQYYETICGGAGAGPTFAGEPAVHTHMTNTRMTDPEILEMRYPVVLEAFSIRPGSGGEGTHPGGDGAIRRLRFLAPMTASIVSQRRVVAPFGLAGGASGAPGRQWVLRADGTREDLPGIVRIDLAVGDVVTIETPGGGGWGAKRP